MKVSHRRGPWSWGLRVKQGGIFVLLFAVLTFSPGDHCNPTEATVRAGGSGYTERVLLWVLPYGKLWATRDLGVPSLLYETNLKHSSHVKVKGR